MATGPIEELNQALTEALEPVMMLTPIPDLLPANAPKKMTQVVGHIEARLVQEGEVTKQMIYMLIAQTIACRKPGCKNVLKKCID